MRSKAWLATRVSLRLARLPRTASSAQRSRRLRSTRAAAPVLLAHANVTENINIFQWVPNLGTQRYQPLHAVRSIEAPVLELQSSFHHDAEECTVTPDF